MKTNSLLLTASEKVMLYFSACVILFCLMWTATLMVATTDAEIRCLKSGFADKKVDLGLNAYCVKWDKGTTLVVPVENLKRLY